MMKNISIVKPEESFIVKRGITGWPVWEKEESDFPWTYDQTEECYILKGEFDIVTEEVTETVREGDFVTFHKGLTCRWIIRKKVRKHYNFINS